MIKPYETEAKLLINAIKTMAEKPENLDNLESYLSMHFAAWLEKFANTPEKNNRRIKTICRNGDITT